MRSAAHTSPGIGCATLVHALGVFYKGVLYRGLSHNRPGEVDNELARLGDNANFGAVRTIEDECALARNPRENREMLPSVLLREARGRGSTTERDPAVGQRLASH